LAAEITLRHFCLSANSLSQHRISDWLVIPHVFGDDNVVVHKKGQTRMRLKTKLQQLMPLIALTRLFALIIAAVAGFGQKSAIAACLLGLVDQAPLVNFTVASTTATAVPANQVRVTYIGHSSFLIQTPGGASAVTDYNGLHVPATAPDIVTMNNSHDSHYTDDPNPEIRYVLPGWSGKIGAGFAKHDVRFKDLRVFNVPTNIGEYGDPKGNGNSIFVFEISGLCIAHLGHLHHVLTRDQLLKLGRIDVLFVPVDGGMTITHPQALAVIKQIEPRLVFPMHFGFFGAPDAFFEVAKAFYPIRSEKGSTMLVSRKMLPRSTEIRFLQGGGGF
jgi:L-ascorbate metabolism protein UlaG (beta-lactamase superfamily)